MPFVAQYVTDGGRVLPYLRMEIAFIDNDLRSLDRINDLNIVTGILPPVLASSLQQFSQPCPYDILPRFVILGLQQGQLIKLAYPFRPSTPEWYQFWQDLNTSLSIVDIQGFGEVCNDKHLRKSLGVL